MMIKRSTLQKWLEKRGSNVVGLTSSTAFTPLSLIFMFIFVYLNVSSFSLVIIATYIDSLSYFRESIRYTLLSLLCSASQLSSPSLHHPSPAVVGRVFSRPTKSLWAWSYTMHGEKDDLQETVLREILFMYIRSFIWFLIKARITIFVHFSAVHSLTGSRELCFFVYSINSLCKRTSLKHVTDSTKGLLT